MAWLGGASFLRTKRLFVASSAVLVATWLYGSFYKGTLHGTPKVYWETSDDAMLRILSSCPSLKRKFYPTFWAAGAYSQLVLLVLYQTLFGKRIKFISHVLKTQDGGELCCDVYKEPVGKVLPNTAPICLFFHTISGNSTSCAEFVQYAFSKGWRPIVLCRRGHFGPLKTPRFNLMGDAEDSQQMIDFIKELYPEADFIGAIGLSAGSGQLVTYLGTQNTEHRGIQAAVSLSPAYCLRSAFTTWNESHPFLAKYVLKSIKNLFLNRNQLLLESHPSFEVLQSTTSVHEFLRCGFDFAGFSGTEEYYEHSNPMNHFRKNVVPCLVMNAMDDPVCLGKNVDVTVAGDIKHYALVVTEYGSHIAFRDGILGSGCFMNRLAIEFLDATRDEYHRTSIDLSLK